MNSSAIRQALDARLVDVSTGTAAEPVAPLSDEEWAALREDGFLDDIEGGTRDGVQRALDFIRQKRAARFRRRRRKVPTLPRSKEQRLHEQTLAEFLAAYVERVDRRLGLGVDQFRQNALDRQLLKPQDIHDWIERQSAPGPTRADEQPATLRLLSYRRYFRLRRGKLQRGPDTKLGGIKTESGLAEPWTREVQTRPGETLDRLRQISDALARYCGWQPAQAVTFVLTSVTPQVPAIDWRVVRREQLPLCSRVVLWIDPTCTPREIEQAYRRIRAREFGRLRRLTEKHARLAVFAARHPGGSALLQPPNDRERELMDLWNRECKKSSWQYRRPGIFARDRRRAYGRMLAIGDWAHESVLELGSSLYTNEATITERRKEGWIVGKRAE